MGSPCISWLWTRPPRFKPGPLYFSPPSSVPVCFNILSNKNSPNKLTVLHLIVVDPLFNSFLIMTGCLTVVTFYYCKGFASHEVLTRISFSCFLTLNKHVGMFCFFAHCLRLIELQRINKNELLSFVILLHWISITQVHFALIVLQCILMDLRCM